MAYGPREWVEMLLVTFLFTGHATDGVAADGICAKGVGVDAVSDFPIHRACNSMVTEGTSADTVGTDDI